MFKKGDKVQAITPWDKNLYKRVGVVISEIPEDESYLFVDFGMGFYGHNGSGRIKTKTGYYMRKDELIKYKKGNYKRYV